MKTKLNELYKRNSNPALFEEEPSETNCGSFALNVTEWYTPYITEDIDEDDEMWQFEEYERERWIMELLADGWSREDVMETVIDRDFEFILMTCPWLVPISEDEIDEQDRVIAYRLSMTVPDEVDDFDADACMDFHFRVLIDGEWWEKNGAGMVHKVDYPDEDIWEVEEWLIYDGPIKYAKFKKEER